MTLDELMVDADRIYKRVFAELTMDDASGNPIRLAEKTTGVAIYKNVVGIQLQLLKASGAIADAGEEFDLELNFNQNPNVILVDEDEDDGEADV